MRASIGQARRLDHGSGDALFGETQLDVYMICLLKEVL